NKRETEASVALTKAVETQRAPVGEAPKDDADEPTTTEKYYESYDKRREAALAQFREVESKYSGTGAAILARLAEGSLLLDKHEADNAIAAYTDVKGSALAAADVEVKGRALEGLGLAYEIKPSLDDALKTFKE